MRELAMAELELVSGGNQTTDLGDIVVIGDRDPGDWGDWGDYGDYGDYGDGGGSGGDTATEPDCHTTNAVTGIEAPDGATYYLPESVDGDYLLAAIKHLQNQPTIPEKMAEFYAMYSNPDHAHFIDFKDWGTDNGPPGSVSGGTTTYWSDALGGWHTGSVFEAFGNYFYGVAGILGGIPPEVLNYAAGHAQAGNGTFEQWFGFGMDAAEDKPHVEKGITEAIGYMYVPHELFDIQYGNCSG